ncbi:hypothetical protein MRB56_12655 [Halomonas cupida]|uniref:hypothetical protein n=1 Tax=Halomonas cupida TaxID=44933 RepID=UPI0039B6CDBD
MFQLEKVASVLEEITVKVPGDHGEVTEATFSVRFRVLDVDEISESIEELRSGKITDDDLFARDVKGWEDISDEKGKPLPFTASNLKKIIRLRWVRQGMVDAWYRVQLGREKAAAKN